MFSIAKAETLVADLQEQTEKLTGFVDDLPDILMKLAVCAVVIALGVLVLRTGRKLIRKIWLRYSRKRRASDAETAEYRAANESTVLSLLTSLFDYIIYFAVLIIVLARLGVDTSSLLTVAGIGGVAISLGSQTLIKDFIAGVFLWIDGYIKIGDTITIGAQTGTVENVALRTTTLRTTNGNLIMIPNGDIRAITNRSRDYRCALVDMTIAHGQDYRAVIAALQQAMNELAASSDIAHEPPKVLGVIASDARCATIRIECRCEINEGWDLEREIRLAALECMARNNFKP